MQANLTNSSLMKEIIQKRGWIDLPADGTSMYPLIKKGNICRFVACKTSAIKKGDVILFQTKNGTLVAHRFLKSNYHLNQVEYLFKGDTNLGMDEPIKDEKIIGKLVLINKGKININMSDVYAFAWCKIILFFPISSALLRGYLNKKSEKRLHSLDLD